MTGHVGDALCACVSWEALGILGGVRLAPVRSPQSREENALPRLNCFLHSDTDAHKSDAAVYQTAAPALSIEVDRLQLSRCAGSWADRVRRGANPAELRVEQPARCT
jgi:hypothetical protein